ncbi:SWF or SNF family helicase [Streptomyces sp. XM4193]|uniref:SWF or SNF family helicase n=1 Tax=Streptomyces sp. XM4193 TaxID=2929782 RepID=UPI001FF9E8C7|nr:SWF or SNF family helicase [Streptomyces sp. XM4193]MCK1798116.1 SWF or SNF family helicase [Streptomyces sp. XM4193]
MSEDGTRETEVERVFEALAPLRTKGFARTPWGAAWQRALEDSALDSGQLRKGRQCARSGAVGAVAVRPGRITAMVRESGGEVHRADVLVPRLDDAAWERLLEVTSRTAGHLAALLDGELPPELVEDADAVQVQLLPGMGDLQPSCDCGEWDHCTHTAAVCYQLARLLDEDPMILLLLLGRGERRILAELRELSFVRAMGELSEEERDSSPRAVGEFGTVPAAEAYARTALWELPAPPAAVRESAELPEWVRQEGPSAPGVDVDALGLLVWDAARRAREALAEALSPGHATSVPAPAADLREDAVRIAARPVCPDTVRRRILAEGGFDARAFETAVHAWRLGGRDGLLVQEGSALEADETQLARAGSRLASAWGEGERMPEFSREGNRWTLLGAGVQLRIGTDGRWWPLRWDGERWLLSGPAGHDPAVLLAELDGLGPR